LAHGKLPYAGCTRAQKRDPHRCYASYNDFCRSVLHFLREQVPKNWAVFCDSVTDNFHVINPADFRVLKA
jgi:hypothetical protein